MIDAYVSDVARRLRGSARMRNDMLTEIKDALADAAEAHEDGGAPTGEARRRAVAEFGPARQIAAGLQDELALVHGRRTAWLLLAVLGSQFVGLQLISWLGEWHRVWGYQAPGELYERLARAVDVFNLFALAFAVVAAIGFRWGPRYVHLGRSAVRGTAVVTWIVLGLTLCFGVLLAALAPGAGASGVATSVLWSAGPFGAVLFSSRRSWRAANR